MYTWNPYINAVQPLELSARSPWHFGFVFMETEFNCSEKIIFSSRAANFGGLLIKFNDNGNNDNSVWRRERSLRAQNTDRELFSLRRHNEKLPYIQTHTHTLSAVWALTYYMVYENTHISPAFVIYKKIFIYINHDKSLRRARSVAMFFSLGIFFLLSYYRYVARRGIKSARAMYIWFKKLHARQNYSTLLCVTLADCCYHH